MWRATTMRKIQSSQGERLEGKRPPIVAANSVHDPPGGISGNALTRFRTFMRLCRNPHSPSVAMLLQNLRGRGTLEEGRETWHSEIRSGLCGAHVKERERSHEAHKEDGKNCRPCHAVRARTVGYGRPLPPGPAPSERRRAGSGRQGDAS